MPSLKDLLGNIPTFNYRTGLGNFIADKIPYEHDLEDGGASGQPYVKVPKDFRWSPSNIDDGIVPFGAVTKATRTAADVLRIGKFLTDFPKGPLFLAKQVGLQLSNVKLESKKTDISPGGILNKINEAFGSTRIFNPLGINLISQVGLNLIGGHINRHGLLPSVSSENSYENVVKFNNNKQDNKFIDSSDENPNRLVKLAGRLYRNTNSTTLFEYQGGPGSFYGIGSTVINKSTSPDKLGTYNHLVEHEDLKEYYGNKFLPSNISGSDKIPIRHDRPDLFNINNPKPNDYFRFPSLSFTSDTSIGEKGKATLIPNSVIRAIGEKYIVTYGSGSNSGYFDFKEQDFRQFKNILSNNGIKGGTILASSDYQTLNLRKRIGIVKTRENNDRWNYASDISGSYSDRVNMLSLFRATNDLSTDTVSKKVFDINGNPVISANDTIGDSNLRDMIKFRIKAIDNDNPQYGVYMVFRAYLKSFSDKSSKKLSTYNYLGRAENFYIEDGYINTFGIGFMIVANSRAEMKPLYQKLNYLKSTLAPDYFSTKMRSSMVEMTVGDYIYQQPGFITDLSIDIDENTNWEIAVNEPESTNKDDTKRDADMHELPMMLNVNISFTPIWNFLPKKSSEAPFISIGDKEGNKKEWLKDTDSKLHGASKTKSTKKKK